ncbi:MAG: ECF transporter S component [Clostridiales Family XIII bacterium]|jgi:uncharacterized membrane protein|nr:ECF transporter S component [Clostridiales Family XIII bacterium]
MNTTAARKTLISFILAAFFIAMSYVLANISFFGTSIALDSLPAFLAALILGVRYGAAVGALGHMFTALLHGFPYTLPVHLLTALMMAVCMLAFGFVYGKLASRSVTLACIVSGAVAVLINGPVAVLVLSPLLLPMMGGWPALLAFMGILSVAAAVNVAPVLAVYGILDKHIDFSRYI